jgi:hypothetical protein
MCFEHSDDFIGNRMRCAKHNLMPCKDGAECGLSGKICDFDHSAFATEYKKNLSSTINKVQKKT